MITSAHGDVAEAVDDDGDAVSAVEALEQLKSLGEGGLGIVEPSLVGQRRSKCGERFGDDMVVAEQPERGERLGGVPDCTACVAAVARHHRRGRQRPSPQVGRDLDVEIEQLLEVDDT